MARIFLFALLPCVALLALSACRREARFIDMNTGGEAFDERRQRDPFADDAPIEIGRVPIRDPKFVDAGIRDHREVVEHEYAEEEPGEEDPDEGPVAEPDWGRRIESGGGVRPGRDDGRPFARRFGREKAPRSWGLSRESEEAVQKGLEWLARHQGPDGTWRCRRFMESCAKGACSGPGSGDEHDMGVTGLAVLAFLGAGQTHRFGHFKPAVRNALKGILDRQASDGCCGPKTGDGRWIYGHVLCALALAEAHAMNLEPPSPLLRAPAQKAVDFLVACRNPGGGWRYGVRPGDSDASVTGWALHALAAAELAGLDVQREAVDGGLAWLDTVTERDARKDDAGSCRYLPGRDRSDRRPAAFARSEAMTAQALFCRIILGGLAAARRPEFAKAVRRIALAPPVWDDGAGTIDMYGWHFGAEAMFLAGGPYWRAWWEAAKRALVASQRRQGCEAGSWDPAGAWGSAGGRVYATAVNVLTLETPYRVEGPRWKDTRGK